MSKLNKLVVFLGAMLLASCASTVTQPDWKLIQSVGGVKVSNPEIQNGEYYLPIELDFSSYKRGTKSALVCTGTSTRVGGKLIFLWIKTDLVRFNPQGTSICPDARLGLIPDGDYRVIFMGADGAEVPISEVTVNLADG